MLSALVIGTGTATAATTAEISAANAVLQLMNTERAAHQLPALGMSTALISSAHRHNLWMASDNTLSHQLPGEPYFSTRISQAGVAWHVAAENIGWTTNRTTSGALGLETAMYNETPPNDGHRRNILSTGVHYVGIDVYLDAGTGKLWLTEDFADVSGGPTAAQIALHNPIGHVDGVTVLPGHKVRLTGWSIDPDYKGVAPLTAVYYDGRYAGYFRTNTPRPDIATRYHAGPDLGFDITLPLPAGRHVITIYAINIQIGNASPRLASAIRTV
ncbi:MAG: CAP domain-containing protein [Jatrophihabitantaceae bacterium]